MRLLVLHMALYELIMPSYAHNAPCNDTLLLINSSGERLLMVLGGLLVWYMVYVYGIRLWYIGMVYWYGI